jgi:hypothetical protein
VEAHETLLGQQNCTHLDNGHDIAGRVAKLAHVDDEMLQLIPLRPLQHQLRSLAHGVDAAQIGHGVDIGIGRLWEGDGGYGRRGGHGGGARCSRGPAQRLLALCVTVCFVGQYETCGFAALPAEKTHDSLAKDAPRNVQQRAVGDRLAG